MEDFRKNLRLNVLLDSIHERLRDGSGGIQQALPDEIQSALQKQNWEVRTIQLINGDSGFQVFDRNNDPASRKFPTLDSLVEFLIREFRLNISKPNLFDRER